MSVTPAPVVEKNFSLRSSGSPFPRVFQKQRVTEFIDVEPHKCPRTVQEKKGLVDLAPRRGSQAIAG